MNSRPTPALSSGSVPALGPSSGGAPTVAEPYRPRWLRTLLLDLAFLLTEQGLVWLLGLALFPQLSQLAPALVGLFLGGATLWAVLATRMRAPFAAQPPQSSLQLRRNTHEQALYRLSTRVFMDGLWLRVVLVVAQSACLGFYGVQMYGLPAEGVAFLLWAAALLTPVLDAPRALLDEQAARRWLARQVATRLSLRVPSASPVELQQRYLLDTYQSRVLLVWLSLLAAGLLVAAASVTLTLLALGQPELSQPELGQILFWSPPLGIGLLVWGVVGLRRATRPIERWRASSRGTPEALAFDPSQSPLDGPALLAAERLPGAIILGQLVAVALALLGFGCVAILGWHASPRLVALLFAEVLLPLLAISYVETPLLSTLLAPLVPAARRSGRPPSARQLLAMAAALSLLLFIGQLWLLRSLLLGGTGSIRLFVGSLVLVASVLAGLAGFARWLGRRLQPLRLLTDGAIALARGAASREPLPPQPSVGTAPSGDAEVMHLHQTLVAMQEVLAERLQSSTLAQTRLEAEVAGRTAELRRRNEELEQALKLLSEAQDALIHAEKMASIGRLVAGLAHEINNPINAVVNSAYPLRESLAELAAGLKSGTPSQIEPSEIASMLRVLERGARRAAEIVQALSNYAQGGADLPRAVDPNHVLEEALELVQHPFKSEVAVVRSYGARHLVQGRAGELQQVFVNLLSNALHALAEGPSPRPQLTLTTAEDSERRELRISVRDNGPGISEAVLPRIFDPFFSTKDATMGSGLGLAIVHGIVARHGGQIRVETAVGEGTCFTVVLPLVD